MIHLLLKGMRYDDCTAQASTRPFIVSVKRPYAPYTQLLSTFLVTRQAPSTATARLMYELKAQGEESHYAFDTCLTVTEQLHVGRFVVKIDSDGVVVADLFGCCAHVSPLGHQVSSADETRWGGHVAISRPSCRAQGVTTKVDGMC